MARAAKTIRTTRSVTTGRKTGRSRTAVAAAKAKATKSVLGKRSVPVVAPLEKRKPGWPPKVAVAALSKPTRVTKTAPWGAAAPPAPKASKDELRAQVEKLEQLVGTLRMKSRETNKTAKAAAIRITELEAQVAQLEENAAVTPVTPQIKSTKPARARRQGREIDPDDTVPLGVAVQEPASVDEEAETALENLEEHLGQG